MLTTVMAAGSGRSSMQFLELGDVSLLEHLYVMHPANAFTAWVLVLELDFFHFLVDGFNYSAVLFVSHDASLLLLLGLLLRTFFVIFISICFLSLLGLLSSLPRRLDKLLDSALFNQHYKSRSKSEPSLENNIYITQYISSSHAMSQRPRRKWRSGFA